jgi:inosine-uridine nucleoside N-ribohydrolase
LILLGPATYAAVALLKVPAIADRLVVFWHGRTEWPLRCWNFNVFNDPKAARLLFEQKCRFVLFDTGTYLRISAEESARRFASLGALGAYLQEIRARKPYFMTAHKGFFDVGDLSALMDPSCVRWEKTRAPSVDHDLRYDFSKSNGEIIRIYHVETEPTFDLLEKSLKRLQQQQK